MSYVIKSAVEDYIKNKEKSKTDNDKDASNFPSDTIFVAGSVDGDLDQLKITYSKLRERIKKDSSLAGKIEDLMENEVRHIIKPY
jgi:hypothetical protein